MARVLVVEDEPRFRRYLVRALSLEGHDVTAAADGHEATTRIRRFSPDVLVVDWMLGAGEDGVALATRLLESRPQLRTILITGHPTYEVVEEDEACAVHVLLRKPFSPRALFEAVAGLAPKTS